MREVSGKVAFITGGASGIGLGMARIFVRNGMKVVIADLLSKHLEEVAREFDGHRGVHLIQLDVVDRAAMARAAEETLRVFGKVHVLCNNVGVSQRNPIDEATYEDWDYVVEVNLGGTINGLVTFLPKIKAHGEGGHVINTSSMAGMIPVPPFAGIYAATKFAIRGLTDSLRLALGPYRIGASVLCPGLTRTRAITAGATYRGAHCAGNQPRESPEPIGHGMAPEDVGERVLHAILRNEPYVFPHGEFKEEVRDHFNEMLGAFPLEQEADALRLETERRRAEMTAKAKAVADAIDAR
ncbi:MAG TPA: SDR family NAD(P)-dependent oxidoreductase [Steroidobacteraceae bacterium]|nr:SDR family NAD(P)-dependent oxidoreductase [Steroidobacteraceae bacterium]